MGGIEAVENVKGKYPLEDLRRKLIGAAIEVHTALEPGFLETIDEEALKVELSEHDLRYEAQKEIQSNTWVLRSESTGLI